MVERFRVEMFTVMLEVLHSLVRTVSLRGKG